MVFFTVFFRTLGFLTALLIFLTAVSYLIYYSNNIQKNQFTMIDGDQNSKNIIGTINLDGPILNYNNSAIGGNFYNYINPKQVESYLEDLEKMKIKILIIKINSPGGTVSATAELTNMLNNFKEKTDVEIFFFTNEILASGAYWIATSANKIFASYGSIIGSIGVSGPSWFYYNNPVSLSSGIFGQSIETKKGIEVFKQNAGQGKDLFNPYRKPENVEIKHLQKIVDEVYDDFISKVSNSRKIDLSVVKNQIGAFIYSSNQAKENFLIDDVIDYKTFIKHIIDENNFENYKILENNTKANLIGNFLSIYKNNNDNKNLNINICNKLYGSINVIIPLYLKEC